MESNKKILISFLILSVFIIAGCGGEEPVTNETESGQTETGADTLSAETIKIGGLGPLTGGASRYGLPAQAAQEIALAEINAEGGVDGRPLEIMWEDGKCTPTDATAAALKLVTVENVKVILGGLCSGETLAAATATEPAKVILLSSGSSSPDITEAGDYVFRTYPSDSTGGSIAAQRALESGYSTAAIINENTVYASGFASTFRLEFERLGGEIVASEVFETDATEVTLQVSAIKNAAPDVILLIPQAGDMGLLVIEELTNQGVDIPIIVDGTISIPPDLVTERPEALDGIIGVEPFFEESNAKAVALFEKYKTEYGQDAPYPFIMSAAYDSVYLIRDAFLQCGTENTDCIRDFLYSVEDYNGAVNGLSIDENGDVVIPYAVYQVVEGERVKIS